MFAVIFAERAALHTATTVEELPEKTQGPEGSATTLLDEYNEKADAAVEKATGGQPCCHKFPKGLLSICTLFFTNHGSFQFLF